MVWYVIAGVALAAAVVMTGFTFVRDRMYLRKKTSEAMSRDLWEEIEVEREDGRRRQQRWRRTFDNAMKRTR